jgi:hypothetical protein
MQVSEFTQEVRDTLSSLGAYLFGPLPNEELKKLSVEYDIKLRGCGDHAFSSLQPVADALAAAHAEIRQLKFLLASAPMIDAPHPLNARAVFTNHRVPFAYIHPKTMAQYNDVMGRRIHGMTIFPGSPTKWVLLSTMPEGRVIYSPLPIPGLEKILGS